MDSPFFGNRRCHMILEKFVTVAHISFSIIFVNFTAQISFYYDVNTPLNYAALCFSLSIAACCWWRSEKNGSSKFHRVYKGDRSSDAHHV